MKKLYANDGYDSDEGKEIERWYTLCDSCLAGYELHEYHDYKITEALPRYEGETVRCNDCGKAD